jgi:hypothetical protein
MTWGIYFDNGPRVDFSPQPLAIWHNHLALAYKPLAIESGARPANGSFQVHAFRLARTRGDVCLGSDQ